MWARKGRIFQAKKTASAKVLRQERLTRSGNSKEARVTGVSEREQPHGAGLQDLPTALAFKLGEIKRIARTRGLDWLVLEDPSGCCVERGLDGGQGEKQVQ